MWHFGFSQCWSTGYKYQSKKIVPAVCLLSSAAITSPGGRRLPVHAAEYVRLHNELVGDDAYFALLGKLRTQIENAAQTVACKVRTA